MKSMRLHLLCFIMIWSTCLIVFLDHMSHPVRHYFPKPLLYKNCWKFGHSKRNFTTCGECEENDCEGHCEKDPEYHLCKENHAAGEAGCPKRYKKKIWVRSKERLQHEEVGKKLYDGRRKEDKSVRSPAELCFCRIKWNFWPFWQWKLSEMYKEDTKKIWENWHNCRLNKEISEYCGSFWRRCAATGERSSTIVKEICKIIDRSLQTANKVNYDSLFCEFLIHGVWKTFLKLIKA